MWEVSDFFFFFSSRIKELRKEKGLTQAELVQDFNKKFNRSYTPVAISQYENEKRLPEMGALQDFAKYFGVSVSYLLGETDIRDLSETKAAQEEGQPLSPEQEELLNLLLILTPEELEKAIDYVQLILKGRTP